jgi:hypothetical protein
VTVKLISHTGECEYPDDTTLPIKLEMVLTPPKFMQVAWIGMCGGSEEIIARSDNLEELNSWIEDHGLKRHSRLIRYEITDNGVVVEKVDKTR